MLERELTEIVGAILARAPDWLRRDLASKEAEARWRAEEALSMMIANAISNTPVLGIVADVACAGEQS